MTSLMLVDVNISMYRAPRVCINSSYMYNVLVQVCMHLRLRVHLHVCRVCTVVVLCTRIRSSDVIQSTSKHPVITFMLLRCVFRPEDYIIKDPSQVEEEKMVSETVNLPSLYCQSSITKKHNRLAYVCRCRCRCACVCMLFLSIIGRVHAHYS